MKDNAPIGDAMADRAKITAKDNVFTLEISKVAAGDKGNYTCRVTNDNGEAVACSAQLEVHACKYRVRQGKVYIYYYTFPLRTLYWYH